MLINLPKFVRLPNNWIDSFSKHLWSIYYLPGTFGYCYCISDKQKKVPPYREAGMLGWTEQRENEGERYWALWTTEFQYFKSHFHRQLFRTVIKKLSKESMINRKWVLQSIRNNVSMKQLFLVVWQMNFFHISFVSMLWERASDHGRHPSKRAAWGPRGENTETIRELQPFTNAIR